MARTGHVKRKTNETDIKVSVNLDGSGKAKIKTGIGFFDHMLEQLAKHSLIDLEVTAKGDLHIDSHHTAEDTGIALGQALKDALGDKKGISRFASAKVAMDEAMSEVIVDVSGRPYLVWDIEFTKEFLGEMDTELFEEFFRALAGSAHITLHVLNHYGSNNHHMIESAFKACARALRQAVAIDERNKNAVPSTKGAL